MAEQLTLLDWTPPQSSLAFEERDVRAATLDARISRAVATALRDAKLSRRKVAEAMSAYLGERVSVEMLDAYASQARATHRISVPRYLALAQATGDRRLIELLAEPLGCAVIERKHLVLIDLAAAREREDAARRQSKALAQRARAEGAL